MTRSSLVRTLTALALATAFVVPLAAPAMAQPHGRPGERQDSWQGRPGPQHYGRPGPQHYERQRYERHDNWRGGGRDNSGALIGGALLGLGVGAIIGGAATGRAGGALAGAAIGGASGAIIGGAATPQRCYGRDQWGRRVVYDC